MRAIRGVEGYEQDWRQSWAAKLPREGDRSFLHAPFHSVHADFQVVVVTRFAPEDYATFLQDELPLDRMQPILVTVEP